MNTLSRLCKHWLTTSAAGRKAFPAATLKAIEAAIAEGEHLHRAEVRLIVEPALATHMVVQHMTSRQRAIDLFAHYRIWDTEENCGVLVYINLADHKVEIVADRGVDRRVAQDTWEVICRAMESAFREGRFEDGAMDGIAAVSELLAQHFPRGAAGPNELPDQAIVL